MDYDAIKAINWSTLRYMATSPLLYRWMLDHPAPRKPAWVVGGAIHCLLFEPEKFDSRYSLFDGTRRGKEWDKWVAEHPGVESLKLDDLGHVQSAVKAVKDHKRAAAIIKTCRVEEPLTWTDQHTGLACKARVDAICPAHLVELKSARDVQPAKFLRASASYLYHAQLAWYHDGAVVAKRLQPLPESSDGPGLPYLIAVQNCEPWDVVVWQMTADALAVGRAVYRGLLAKLIQCREANWWPGCAPDLQQLTIPAYLEGVIETTDEEF